MNCFFKYFLVYQKTNKNTNAIAKSYYKIGEYQLAIHFYKKGILKNFGKCFSFFKSFNFFAISKQSGANKPIDINLFSSMLVYKEQNEFTPVPVNNFYLSEKIKDEELQKLYQEFILFYNNQAFSDCL